MSKNFKSLLVLDAILVGLGVIGIIIYQFVSIPQTFVKAIDLCSNLGRILALLLIYFAGTLKHTKWPKRLIFIFFAFTLIGILFILEHLPLGRMIHYLSLLGIAIIYLFHFFKKQKKGALDYVKLLWLLLFNVNAIFRLEHLPFSNLLQQTSLVLFLLMFALFFYDNMKQAKPLPAADSFLENDNIKS